MNKQEAVVWSIFVVSLFAFLSVLTIEAYTHPNADTENMAKQNCIHQDGIPINDINNNMTGCSIIKK